MVSTSYAQPIPKGDFNSDARRPEITVKDYREFVAGQPAERSLMYLYIAGIGDGIRWANIEATLRKQPFYCPADKLPMETPDLLDILNREIEGAAKNKVSKFDEMPIGAVLLAGLIRAFPCTNYQHHFPAPTIKGLM